MVTIFESLYKTDKPHKITLDAALKRISSGLQEQKVAEIRNGNKEAKKQLPIVLFSGEFDARSDEALTRHSGYIVLDFDNLNPDAVKPTLASDRYTRACWVSPSGNGLKVLVEVSNPERHRDHFRSMVEYYDNEYGLELDGTGINESRACFESYDPDIVIRESSDKFGGMRGANEEVQEVQEVKTRTDYEKIHIAACMIRGAKDGEKHSALLRASVLLGGWVATGQVEEHMAKEILFFEISKRSIDDEDLARKTINDGIEKGKQLPINELLMEEDKVIREMKLQDGDMSFISSGAEDLQWIEDYIAGNLELGLSTGNDTLDRNFVFKKEFVMINGHSNVGKTTFTLWLMVAASMHHNWRWVVYSAENKTAAIKLKLMQFACDMKVHDMNHAQLKRAFDWVDEHFVIISNENMLSYSEVLLYTEKIHRNKPIDGLFIDPYNSLRIDMSNNRHLGVHEYHYEAASEFLTFANRLGVAVWVNAHSVTSAQRQKGPDGLPTAPYAEDTEGGGKFMNRCDCFITLHRKIQHDDPVMRRCVEFHVRKVRETDTGGKPTSNDRPYMFQFNDEQTGFSMFGPEPKLYGKLLSSSENASGNSLQPNMDFINLAL